MEYEIPEWDKNDFTVVSEKVKDDYTLTRYELPDVVPVQLADGTVFDDKIVIDYYLHSAGAPTLMVHPILGGKKNRVAVTTAKEFVRKAKWNVALIHRARVPMKYGTLEAIEPGFVNTITNNIQAFEWLEFHNKLDRDKAVCMGVSMGAITTAMLSAILPVKGFICIMAGADIPEIVTRSKEEGIVEWRNEVLAEQNMTLEQLDLRLQGIIKTDPKFLAPKADPKKVLMFITLFDKIVPTKNQRKLRRKFTKKPKTYWVWTGHKTIILRIFSIIKKSRKWAKKAIK